MNVYILVSKDKKSFKIGKANCVTTRIQSMGDFRFDTTERWYVTMQEEKEAFQLERLLHKVYAHHKFHHSEYFDGSSEYFDISVLNSALVLAQELGGTLYNFVKCKKTVSRKTPYNYKNTKEQDFFNITKFILENFKMIETPQSVRNGFDFENLTKITCEEFKITGKSRSYRSVVIRYYIEVICDMIVKTSAEITINSLTDAKMQGYYGHTRRQCISMLLEIAEIFPEILIYLNKVKLDESRLLDFTKRQELAFIEDQRIRKELEDEIHKDRQDLYVFMCELILGKIDKSEDKNICYMICALEFERSDKYRSQTSQKRLTVYFRPILEKFGFQHFRALPEMEAYCQLYLDEIEGIDD